LTRASSPKSLINSIVNNDRGAIAAHLSNFKDSGITNFKAVLAVPIGERLPALTNTPEGYNELLMAISVSITVAMSNFNLRMGLTEKQTALLADQIIASSHEDNLGLEDVLLFLQELVSGKAGKVYDRMDIPTFFELFENYRQRRHEELLNYRYEQSVNHKALGSTKRSSEDTTSERDSHRQALGDHLKHIYKAND
jgi:hypothetical protein